MTPSPRPPEHPAPHANWPATRRPKIYVKGRIGNQFYEGLFNPLLLRARRRTRHPDMHNFVSVDSFLKYCTFLEFSHAILEFFDVLSRDNHEAGVFFFSVVSFYSLVCFLSVKKKSIVVGVFFRQAFLSFLLFLFYTLWFVSFTLRKINSGSSVFHFSP